MNLIKKKLRQKHIKQIPFLLKIACVVQKQLIYQQ